MKIKVNIRSDKGTSANRRLRRAGWVPAVIYGGSSSPKNIQLVHNEIYHILRKEELRYSILNVEIKDGEVEQVLLRATQWHAYKPQVIHIDFQRIDVNKTLNTIVPIRFVNAENSPAVKIENATISHVLTELEIVCLPARLPKFIEVDLSQISRTGAVHLNDIKLPEGIKCTTSSEISNPLIATANIRKEKNEDKAP